MSTSEKPQPPPKNSPPDAEPEEDFWDLDYDWSAFNRRAIAWIEAQWPEEKRICPICGTDDWSVQRPLGLEPFGRPPFDGATFPIVPISCNTCGYMRFLDSFVARLLEPTRVDEE